MSRPSYDLSHVLNQTLGEIFSEYDNVRSCNTLELPPSEMESHLLQARGILGLLLNGSLENQSYSDIHQALCAVDDLLEKIEHAS